MNSDRLLHRSRRQTNQRSSNAIDWHVGSRMRLRRLELGMSQERLAEHLGVTFQQVQKYERGANRIGASRLHQIGRTLDVPITYFFDGVDEQDGPRSDRNGAASPLADAVGDPMTMRLLRAFASIEHGQVRHKAVAIIEALAGVPGVEARHCGTADPGDTRATDRFS